MITGEDVKRIRRELGLTQKQLAAVLGYAHAIRISEFERLRNPTAIPVHVAMLMDAIEKGYRPLNWPQPKKKKERR
jgi:transcriptional regulator with XRE-family HTH domain